MKKPQGRTLLILDDERHVTAALRRSLRGEGYRILLAHGRDEAVAHLEREPIDAVLSDASMPGVEGVAFLAEVERWRPEAARILVTAWPERISSAWIRSAGIAAVIPKPWDLAELRGVIRAACR
jgi:response regulator RpfG family c-di-GMP phosphodiesterase